jgi:hypothetical protein
MWVTNMFGNRNVEAAVDGFLYDVGAALAEWLRQADERAAAAGPDSLTRQTQRKLVEDVERLRDEVVSILQITAYMLRQELMTSFVADGVNQAADEKPAGARDRD